MVKYLHVVNNCVPVRGRATIISCINLKVVAETSASFSVKFIGGASDQGVMWATRIQQPLK